MFYILTQIILSVYQLKIYHDWHVFIYQNQQRLCPVKGCSLWQCICNF